jgi:O-antigen ligase
MFGMNPNQVAMVSGFCFLLALATAIYVPGTLSRLIAYVSCGIIFVGAALTGSRGGMGALALGSLALLAPIFRRPVAAGVVGTLITVTVYVISGYLVGETGFDRLASVQNTREGVWRYTFERVLEAPIFGHGLLTTIAADTGRRVGFNSHSIYLTVLLNQGIVGAVLFALTLGVIARQYLRVFRWLATVPAANRWPAYLGAAMLVASLSYGLVEAAPITGVAIYSLAIGFACGLADWILRPQEAPTGALAPAPAEASIAVGFDWV